MGQLNINHIKAALKKRFESLIDLSDQKPELPPDQRESHLLTRSLAAFIIAELARTDDRTAANSAVDGSNDNGIDAFYYDRSEHVCYLVQAKWSHNGRKSVEVGEALKFVQGVRDLLQPNLDCFGKLRAKADDIDSALTDSSATFLLVLAYTGEPQISQDVRRPFEQLLAEENSPDELISFRSLRQADLYQIIGQAVGPKAVNMQVMLREWGIIKEPYLAYYGYVELEEIGGWKTFGPSLFRGNLRGFKGDTEINNAIAHTARYAPAKFWYFNNGVTVLCNRLSKKPQGGSNRESGIFDCEGATVVNGAQTVGSIITAIENGPNGFHQARVMVRLISLEKCEPTFGAEVTRAANTQNRVEKRDFAAQDPEQSRLQTEVYLECGKFYSYKTGDKIPTPEEGFTLDEAAVALACAWPNVDLCTQAKREVGKLYEDIKQPPYTNLFNTGLSPLKLWRAVEVLRGVDAALKEQQAVLRGRERLISVHGNRFILHLVFAVLEQPFDPGTGLEGMLTKVPVLVEDLLRKTIATTERQFSTAYPANLFKNASKCKELATAILKPEDSVEPSQPVLPLRLF